MPVSVYVKVGLWARYEPQRSGRAYVAREPRMYGASSVHVPQVGRAPYVQYGQGLWSRVLVRLAERCGWGRSGLK